jgi:hypothetical protein
LPIDGPTTTTREFKQQGVPLARLPHISARMIWLRQIGPPAAIPARRRRKKSWDWLVAKPQAMLRMMNNIHPDLITGTRPYLSESGAIKMVPIPSEMILGFFFGVQFWFLKRLIKQIDQADILCI